MKTFNGKKVAERIFSDLEKRIRKLKNKPVLAVILIGEDRASELYIKLKKKAALKIGAKLVLYRFKKNSKEKEIINKIGFLNEKKGVYGIIIQFPLPVGFKPDKIVGKISPEKDVDGFQEKSSFSPVLPMAILTVLRKAINFPEDKRILAIVNSKIFGETLKKFLRKEKIKTDYILNKKLSQEQLKKRLKSADVLITACGNPCFVKSDMIKRGVVLIDAGISRLSGKKVLGDVDKESVKNKAYFITPVPGGIGPLTVALLFKNLYYATKHS